jgi:two-component system, NtrC family, response regulator
MGQVLIIDDDSDYAEMMSRFITALGYETRSAGMLSAGRRLALECHPELVFLDVNLPDGCGLGSIRELRESPSRPEVIVVTGDGNEDGAAQAITSGAWDYWQKGRSMRELAVPMARAIEYRRERLARARPRVLDLAGMIAESQAMRACADLIAEAAACEAPVLVRGETGTGKELAARAIHNNSQRAQGPFVIVDCAALPETLVESLLFGHEKGSFTGASSDRVGMVRQAHGGTLFLDEIGELPLMVQKSFLRVLQERRFRPVGADREASSDFRLVAATNRDLAGMLQEGKFREDLFFRLRSLEILLPPLREREGDIALIAQALVERLGARTGAAGKKLSESFFEAIANYPWPGNVRELSNVMERAVAAAADRPLLEAVDLPTSVRVHVARASLRQELNLQRPQAPYASYPTLSVARDSAVAAYLTKLVEDTKGDVDTACQLADLSRSRFYELLKLHGIQKPTG